MLPRFHHEGGIDLVNFGDIRVFMLCNDNLYANIVPDKFKRFNQADHYLRSPQNSMVTLVDLESTDDPKYAVFISVKHLLDMVGDIAFHDVGCFVGDVGLQFANFARTYELPLHVHLYDPTLSGQLVPYNIALNTLEDYCTYHPVAVSDYEGFALFSELNSHSDSSRISLSSNVPANSIVPIMPLCKALEESGLPFFLKLDTENQEARILRHAAKIIQSSINIVGFEYHAYDDQVTHLIADLVSTHYIFDIGYLPKPFMSKPLEETVEDVLRLRNEVANRPFRYTDLLAISRKTPNVAQLIHKLRSMRQKPCLYELVLHDSD